MSIAEKLTTIAENEQKVFEAGRAAERDAFWDMYQDYGRRTNYACGFGGRGWNDVLFKPKYDIKPDTSYMMFRATNITDLSNLPIKLDFSKSTNFQYMFQWADTKYIGEIDTRGASTAFNSMFSYAYYLESIENLIFKDDGSQNLSSDMFSSTSALRDINITGTIGKSLNFQHSPRLSKESITSVINALSDTATGQTLTLREIAVQRSFVRTVYCDMEAKTWEENGITYTCDGNGTFTINGTCNSESSSVYIPFPTPTTAGEIWIVDSGITYGDIFVNTFIHHPDGTMEGTTDCPAWTFTTQVGSVIELCIVVREGETFNNYAFTPLLKIFTEEWDELKATKPNWTISLV